MESTRSRASAYLADDDHGPLALQEILLAGCPTVGVRTGASFVRAGETGVVVDRLPPGQQCVETDEDVQALAVFREALEQAQSMDRHGVRNRAAEQFVTERIVDSIITAVNNAASAEMSLEKIHRPRLCQDLLEQFLASLGHFS